MSPGRATRGLLLVSLLGAAVRVAHVLATRDSFVLANDGADYQRLARSILAGSGFGTSHFAEGGGPTALRPPGYPVLLAAVEGVTGGGVLTARLAGALLGALAVPLTVLLARRLGRSPRAALVAGAVVALLPQQVLISTSLVSEVLFVPLTVAVVLCGLVHRQTGARWALWAAGASLGLAVVTRPVGLVLLPVLVLLARPRLVSGRSVGHALLALAVGFAPALAWEVRSVSRLGAVVPLTTQGGVLVAGTYNATSASQPDQPGVWLPPQLDPAVKAALDAHPTADEAETSRLLQHQAGGYLRDHPSYAGTVVVHNALLLLDLTHPAFVYTVLQGEFGVRGGVASAEQVLTLLLLVGAGAGLARGGARGWPVGVWLAPLLLVAATLPVQSFTRFRAPVEPFLALLVAAPFLRRADDRKTGALDSLTTARFPAALVVVLLHSALLLHHQLPRVDDWTRLVRAGSTGVSFFFLLSGFVLTWSSRAEDVARRFYQRRAARVLPLHVLAWLLTVLVYLWVGAATPLGPAVASLLLVHAWVPSQRYFGAINTPAWSLSCELFFYALFPVVLPRLRRLSPRGQLRLAVALLGVPVLGAVLLPLPRSSGQWLVVDAPFTRLAEFVLGALIALAVRRGAPRVPLWAATGAVLASLAAVDVIDDVRLSVVVPLLPLAALLAAMAQAELAGGARLLVRRTGVRLGQWSFALLLVLWQPPDAAAHLHPAPFSSAAAGFTAVAVVVAVAVGLSGLLFTYVERPLERRLRPEHDVPLALRSPDDAHWQTGPHAEAVPGG
jgi:peptidoglycan/LPS O-acetylase OafA/YrhL/4-amino-4-deoxy-L-arabinose transferase-like glycosyltransferase